MIGRKSALLPLKLENLRLACQVGGFGDADEIKSTTYNFTTNRR